MELGGPLHSGAPWTLPTLPTPLLRHCCCCLSNSVRRNSATTTSNYQRNRTEVRLPTPPHTHSLLGYVCYNCRGVRIAVAVSRHAAWQLPAGRGSDHANPPTRTPMQCNAVAHTFDARATHDCDDGDVHATSKHRPTTHSVDRFVQCRPIYVRPKISALDTFSIRYDTTDDLHWKTDRQAASFI